jgi:hypothetical protein
VTSINFLNFQNTAIKSIVLLLTGIPLTSMVVHHLSVSGFIEVYVTLYSITVPRCTGAFHAARTLDDDTTSSVNLPGAGGAAHVGNLIIYLFNMKSAALRHDKSANQSANNATLTSFQRHNLHFAAGWTFARLRLIRDNNGVQCMRFKARDHDI